MRPRLVVLAKAPRIGGAKSRLAAEIGRVQAWRVYRALTAATLRAAHDPRWACELWVSPDRAATALGFDCDVWAGAMRRVAQGPGDLGQRLERALGAPGASVVIGTDAAGVRAHDFAEAFKALRRAPTVYGPAADGGFWLLGVRQPLAQGALSGVRWSSSDALADVIARLGEGPRLRTLIDVDDRASLRAAGL